MKRYFKDDLHITFTECVDKILHIQYLITHIVKAMGSLPLVIPYKNTGFY